MSSSGSACGACKSYRRKCTQDCLFAPYFPPDQQQKFINVHKVFGTSNVAKLLKDLNPSQREDAVASLAYEADCRLRDPVYGCAGLIFIQQQRIKQLQTELKELASYVGPSSSFPVIEPNFMQQPGMSAAHGGQVIIRDPQQHQHQQMLEAVAAAAASAREQQEEMLRSYEQHQQPADQAELMRFNSGFDTAGAATATAFNQMPAAAGAGMSSPEVFGSYENFSYHPMHQPPSDTSHSHPQAHQFQFQSQIMLQQQPQENYLPQGQLQPIQSTLEQQPQRAQSEECRTIDFLPKIG